MVIMLNAGPGFNLGATLQRPSTLTPYTNYVLPLLVKIHLQLKVMDGGKIVMLVMEWSPTEFIKLLVHRTITEPRCTITEPRRTITEPCRTITEPLRTITEPRRTITEPRRTITEPCRTITEPRRTITEPRRTITELCLEWYSMAQYGAAWLSW
jgi:hypothetical protein